MILHNVLSISTLLFLWAAGSVANAIESEQTHDTKTAVACENIDKFTTKWFLDHVKDDFKESLNSNALFYTRSMSKQAIKYAKSTELVTIWAVWPCELYDAAKTEDNPMRCIHHDPTNRTVFYENMARAFAMKANGSATVMHGYEDYDNPPLDGIWGRVELFTMKEGTNVKYLTKVREDGTGHKIFWRRNSDRVPTWIEQQNRLMYKMGYGRVKRSDSQTHTSCGRRDDYNFFDEIK